VNGEAIALPNVAWPPNLVKNLLGINIGIIYPYQLEFITNTWNPCWTLHLFYTSQLKTATTPTPTTSTTDIPTPFLATPPLAGCVTTAGEMIGGGVTLVLSEVGTIGYVGRRVAVIGQHPLEQ
jgi:hypothetical protein